MTSQPADRSATTIERSWIGLFCAAMLLGSQLAFLAAFPEIPYSAANIWNALTARISEMVFLGLFLVISAGKLADANFSIIGLLTEARIQLVKGSGIWITLLVGFGAIALMQPWIVAVVLAAALVTLIAIQTTGLLLQSAPMQNWLLSLLLGMAAGLALGFMGSSPSAIYTCRPGLKLGWNSGRSSSCSKVHLYPRKNMALVISGVSSDLVRISGFKPGSIERAIDAPPGAIELLSRRK